MTFVSSLLGCYLLYFAKSSQGGNIVELPIDNFIRNQLDFLFKINHS